ncbi:hypothetical protein ACFFIX_01650 [Metabacillus herbersteinensis]|uniref:Uncharacterized protein n=1 Tax=Metabacillus herbersteinensis TaxID=283816 RepID=A0ABV6G9D7_9BACI
MDKPSSEPIRIKINGKEREITESKKNNRELKGEIPFSSWQEKINSEHEVASAKQEEEFPWLLPDEDEVYKEDPKVVTPFKKKKQTSNQTITPYQYSSKKKNPSYPLKQLVSIIIFAIVLGVGFGFIALNFLSNEEMPTTASVEEPVSDGTETSAGTSSEPEEKNL